MSTKQDFSLIPVSGRLNNSRTSRGNYPRSVVQAYCIDLEDQTPGIAPVFDQGNFVETLLFLQDSPTFYTAYALFAAIDSPIVISNWFYKAYLYYSDGDLGVATGFTPLLTPDKSSYDQKEIITGSTETNNIQVQGYQHIVGVPDIGGELSQEAVEVAIYIEAMAESDINYSNTKGCGGLYPADTPSNSPTTIYYAPGLIKESQYTQQMHDDGYYNASTEFGYDVIIDIVGIWKEHTNPF